MFERSSSHLAKCTSVKSIGFEDTPGYMFLSWFDTRCSENTSYSASRIKSTDSGTPHRVMIRLIRDNIIIVEIVIPELDRITRND
jgi:hypothetical protein